MGIGPPIFHQNQKKGNGKPHDVGWLFNTPDGKVQMVLCHRVAEPHPGWIMAVVKHHFQGAMQKNMSCMYLFLN